MMHVYMHVQGENATLFSPMVHVDAPVKYCVIKMNVQSIQFQNRYSMQRKYISNDKA